MMSRPSSARAALVLAAVLAGGSPPAAAATGNPSLSADFQSIMQWFSGQLVQPLAFNAGDTFPSPLLTKPGRGQLELTAGGGLLPIDNSHFPLLQNQKLNDMGIKDQFPKETPFGDMTSTLRYGLPWDMDLAIRFSNVTLPRVQIASGMEASAQSNNYGLQLRKFLHCGSRDSFSVTTYYQYHPGVIHFYNRFDNITLTSNPDGSPAFSVSSQNTGTVNWNLQAAGLNFLYSHAFGDWVPFVGVGYNQAFGSLRAELHSQFETSLISDSVGQASSKPNAASMRGLFGVHLRRTEGMDYFLSGEFLANREGLGQAVNVHMGVMFPLRFGDARRDAAKVPFKVNDKDADKKLARMKDNSLFFIH